MIILGKNSDDKGTQLETLTTALLRQLGYKNVACNVLGAGADELDVTAEVETSMPGHALLSKIICECKAYKSPVDLPAWLKFLGKLFYAEATSRQTVLGCFVALSGVNGACLGHYTELRKHRQGVTLLAGDGLLEEVRKVFPFCTLDALGQRLDHLTTRRSRLKEVVYYEGCVYWVVAFDHDAYTLLDAEGVPLSPDAVKPLRAMADASLGFGSFIDLSEEARARERATLARKHLIAGLMLAGGTAELASLRCPDDDINSEELQQSVADLVAAGVVRQEEATGPVALVTTDDAGLPMSLGRVYRLLLEDAIPVRVLGCPFYDGHIGARLMGEIRAIQGGLPLSEAQEQKALALLHLSPTALVAALMPIDLIVNHRGEQVTTPEIDACDVDVFFQTLYGLLRLDFQRRPLAEYFHETRKVVEIDVASSVRIKSYSRVELEDQTRVRVRIGQLDPSMVQGQRVFVQMQAMNNAPDPWER